MFASSNKRIRKASISLRSKVSSRFESLDFDVWKNDLEVEEEKLSSFGDVIIANITRWMLYFIAGLLIGVITASIDVSLHHFYNLRESLISPYLKHCQSSSCYRILIFAWYSRTIVPALATSMLVNFVPEAAGSGIPKLKAYLNGIHILGIDKFRVLIVKFIGAVLISTSGLASGKEGPVIHIGAIIGSLTLEASIRTQFPKRLWRHLSANYSIEKRDIMTAGYAAGFAAAFGSVMGGTLLSIEEGTSFFSLQLMWMVYFCCASTVWSYGICITYAGLRSANDLNPAYFNFGYFEDGIFKFSSSEIPAMMLVGVLGGFIGAFFVHLCAKLENFRSKFVRTKMLQFIDVCVISITTSSIAIISIILFKECISLHQGSNFNLLDRNMSSVGRSSVSSLLIFLVIFFTLFVLTFGLKLPVGCFIPSILLGATWGRIYGEIVYLIIPPSVDYTGIVKYSVLGAAAQLGGIMRITMSLAVVMLHATQSTDNTKFSTAIIVVFYISKWVGDCFTEDVYEAKLHLAGLPFLAPVPPLLTSDVTARDLMDHDVIAFPILPKVSNVVNVFKKYQHQGFPVVDYTGITQEQNFMSVGRLIGSVLRLDMLILLCTKSFCDKGQLETGKDGITIEKLRFFRSKKLDIKDMEFSDCELDSFIDLSPIMNWAPYSILWTMPLPRMFRLLRELGLRHLIVVDGRNQVVGIITRKSLAKIRVQKPVFKMSLVELDIV